MVRVKIPRLRLILLILTSLLALALLSGMLAAATRAGLPDAHTLAVGAVPQDRPGTGPWVVRVYYPDRSTLDMLASQIEPWEVHPDEGYLVVMVDRQQLDWISALGLRVEVDDLLTAQVNQPPVRLPGQVTGIPGYPCYRTVEETYTTTQEMAAAYPGLASWVDIGDTWKKETFGTSGYDLIVLKLTNALIPGPKPVLFVMSSIHAREYSPAELNTRFAEYLLQNYNVDADVTWLLDYNEIHLLLQANPDGRKRAETGLFWRKNTDNNFCPDTNTRGVDLNRNFEFRWNCCGGSSSNACSDVYRGPSAASEPETRAVQEYVRGIFPDQREPALDASPPPDASGVFIDLHSYGNLVLWPWGFDNILAPSSGELQTLGRKFAWFNNYTPQQAIELYATDGATDDFGYGDLGVAAYTFELGTSFFQNCSTFEGSILPANLPALLYAARVARAPYMTPSGPDALSVTVSPTLYFGTDTIQIHATLDDTRFRNTNGIEPTQNISTAQYTIDLPPWITSTVTYTMSASDGLFNSRTEQIGGGIDLSGLTLGRHTIFLRGQDTAGNWGPVSAIFILVSPERKIYLPALNR